MKSLPALLALSLLFGSVQAQIFKLDDSTSPRSRVAPRAMVDEHGTPLQRALEPDHAILQFGQVVYRLNMQPHLGHKARIFLVRAPENGPPGGNRLNWGTAGGQPSGSLLGGQRALVWSGPVTEPWMEFTLHLELEYNLLRWRPKPGRGNEVATWFELERQP